MNLIGSLEFLCQASSPVAIGCPWSAQLCVAGVGGAAAGCVGHISCLSWGVGVIGGPRGQRSGGNSWEGDFSFQTSSDTAPMEASRSLQARLGPSLGPVPSAALSNVLAVLSSSGQGCCRHQSLGSSRVGVSLVHPCGPPLSSGLAHGSHSGYVVFNE